MPQKNIEQGVLDEEKLSQVKAELDSISDPVIRLNVWKLFLILITAPVSLPIIAALAIIRAKAAQQIEAADRTRSTIGADQHPATKKPKRK